MRGGIEAAAHAARIIMDKVNERAAMRHLENADHAEAPYGDVVVILSTDIRNAFNSISRTAVAAAVRDWFPHLMPYAKWTYGANTKPTVNYFVPTDAGKVQILTADVDTGVLQGSTLAQLFFDAAFDKVLDETAKEAGDNVTTLAIHDDVNLIGHPVAVAKAMSAMIRICDSLELQLRPEKCKLYVRPEDRVHENQIRTAFDGYEIATKWPAGDADEDAGEGHRHVEGRRHQNAVKITDGVDIGGVPVGTTAYVIDKLKGHETRFSKLQHKLIQLVSRSAQSSLLITRMCMIPMANHLMRTLPPATSRPFAVQIDRQIYELLTHLITDDPHRSLPRFIERHEACQLQSQAARRLKSGGLGFPRNADRCEMAFVGSIALVANLLTKMQALSTILQDLHAADQDDPATPSYMIDITSAYEKVKDLTGDVDILPLDQAVLEQRPGLQHQFAAAWEDQITDFGARDPISAFPASCMQRVQSQAGSGAMFWLTHVPHSPADRMSTTEIRTALQYALGLDLDILKGVRRCYKGHTVGPKGHHFMAIACGAPNGRTGTGNWRQQRHNAIRDLIAKIARQAGLQIAVERDMLPGIHPGIRADVILYDFPRRGTHTAVDVMVKALLGGRDQSLFTCAAAAGHMAAAGEREKAVHYRGLAEPYTLTPAVIEQYGRCGRLADELLNELADHRTAKLLSAPREGITEHPMYNRVKGPLFEHWKRAFSFALYKQTVECIHHGVTNAKTRQQQGNGPDGYDCDLHHEDLEQELRRYDDYA